MEREVPQRAKQGSGKPGEQRWGWSGLREGQWWERRPRMSGGPGPAGLGAALRTFTLGEVGGPEDAEPRGTGPECQEGNEVGAARDMCTGEALTVDGTGRKGFSEEVTLY